MLLSREAGHPSAVSIVPAGVHVVTPGNPVDRPFQQCRIDVFNFFCGEPGPDTSRFHNGSLGNERPCPDDGIAVDHRAIHDDGPHADEDVVVDGAAMDDRVVGNRNVVPNGDRGFQVGTMDDSAILDIHVITYPYCMDIPTDHGVEPDAAMVSYNHITREGGIVCQKTVFTNLWPDTFN